MEINIEEKPVNPQIHMRPISEKSKHTVYDKYMVTVHNLEKKLCVLRAKISHPKCTEKNRVVMQEKEKKVIEKIAQ